jgi:flagellar basal-body rod protein FlgB
VDPLSSVVINRALDGLTMRYAATAENIANANSRGYRPVRVTFEESLRTAAAQGPDAVGAVTPRVEREPVPAFGSEMRLDLELATAAATANRYAALIDLLGRQMQITRTVITGGQ